ncbi:MAG: electron transfer flavoprotein subunit alpha/FixB family protein, partial [Proteobacteria bacterium]|nr:electron transfer flavoprotein subunit alpha/FixB family protein [Pseudomonadota bacterium]
MAVLVIAEHDNAKINPATLNTVTAAMELGDVTVLVAGQGCRPAALAAQGIGGVARVLIAEAAHLEYGLAENLAPVIAGLAADYGHLLAPATTFGKNLMPRVAALLDVQQISEITGIESPDTFIRPIYAGNAMATVKSSDAVKVITVRITAFEAAAGNGGGASGGAIEEVPAGEDQGLSAFVGQELTKSERPELTSAAIVISGGRGMQSGENFKLLEDIAAKLWPA